MPARQPSDLQQPLRVLRRIGLLLLADSRLPSVASLVAGEPVRGSWWGHPRGQDIYRVSEALTQRPDVLTVRLVQGKVTFVHRRLWPALLAVATARERWQTGGLSPAARALLRRVQATGALRTDALAAKALRAIPRPGDAARELQQRLLIVAEEVHTERGAHALQLQTWQHWMRQRHVAMDLPEVEAARACLEQAVAALQRAAAAQPAPVPALLPWSARH
jgi:hypothetical protein